MDKVKRKYINNKLPTPSTWISSDNLSDNQGVQHAKDLLGKPGSSLTTEVWNVSNKSLSLESTLVEPEHGKRYVNQKSHQNCPWTQGCKKDVHEDAVSHHRTGETCLIWPKIRMSRLKQVQAAQLIESGKQLTQQTRIQCLRMSRLATHGYKQLDFMIKSVSA